MVDFNLADAGLGAVEERFQEALQQVAENVSDPNRDPSAKREIIIKFVYKPSKSNSKFGELTTSVTTKLAAMTPLTSGFAIGIDGNGEVKAKESVQRELFEDTPGMTSTKEPDPVAEADQVAQEGADRKGGKKIAFVGQ